MRKRICSVKGCQNEAVRSLSMEVVKEASLDLNMEGRRVYLCKEHYKQVKKARRKIERFERWRWK